MVRGKSREGGKVIDYFRFHVGKKEYNLPVRILKKGGEKEHRRSPKPETIKVEFSISIPNRKGETVKVLHGTDIEVLRAGAREALGDQHAIAWENYYLIEVEEHHSRYYGGGCDGGDGVEFSWQTIRIGTTAEGETVHTGARYRGEEIVQGWPKKGRVRGSVISYVKETPETTAALKEFAKRMKVLREGIEKYLGPQHIEKTLSQASAAGFVLPAPPKKKRRKKHG